MTVELTGRDSGITYTNEGWRKVVHLALRYGWKPAGAKVPSSVAASGDEQDAEGSARTTPAETPRGFDEPTWAFSLDSTRGIPPEHPLAYSFAVLLYCEDPVVWSYLTPSRVKAADARALAAALEKSLPHMPDGAKSFRDHKPRALFNPLDWCNPRDREHLRDLIVFCKGGTFKLVP